MSGARKQLGPVLLLACLAAAVRLLAMPFATTDSADPISRTWIAWRWLADPGIITHGFWGPLHFYLIGLVLALTHDSVTAPVLLHIAFSAATIVPLYYFTRNETGDHRGALFSAGSFALYPVAISTSLIPVPESPFLFLFALTLALLSVARRDGSWKHAAGAGVVLSLAGMLRYEAWVLTPFLAAALWRRKGLLGLFLGFAILHPVVWMIGNQVHHLDPFYSFHAGSRFELEMMGSNEGLTLRTVLKRLLFFPLVTIRGMTPVLGGLCLIGAVVAVLRRRASTVWLAAFLALMVFLMASAARGSLPLKIKYTATLGMLLLPYLAEFHKEMPALLGRLAAKTRIAEWALILLLVLWVAAGVLPDFLQTPVLPVDAIPRGANKAETGALAAAIRAEIRGEDDGVIVDFFGWANSYYTALLTRLHPDRIFVAPGAPKQEIDREEIEDFLEAHAGGVLVLMSGSRLQKALGISEDGEVEVGDTHFRIVPVKTLSVGTFRIGVHRYAARDSGRNAGSEVAPEQ